MTISDLPSQPVSWEQEFAQLRTQGIKVNYWVVCPRKLWLFSRGLSMEPLSERVALGRLLHEQAYPQHSRRELFIDELIRVDVLEAEPRVLEIKHSRKMIEAARLQVAYYLLYLRWLGVGELVGELRFPRERRREEVRLTEELEREVLHALQEIRRIEQLPRHRPPPLCRSAAGVRMQNSAGDSDAAVVLHLPQRAPAPPPEHAVPGIRKRWAALQAADTG
jgi:CRISPR-associated exonuclease Cas4